MQALFNINETMKYSTYLYISDFYQYTFIKKFQMAIESTLKLGLRPAHQY